MTDSISNCQYSLDKLPVFFLSTDIWIYAMTHTKNAAFNKLRSPELFSLLAGCDEEFVAPPPLEQNPTLQLAYAVFFDVPGIERLKAETP